MSAQAPIAVLGAGLSGLACAHALTRAGRGCIVLEAADRVGGVVGSVRDKGFLFEMGPHTLQARSGEFRRLCGELGIAERLIASHPAVRERYLWVDGRLRALPKKPWQLLTTSILSWKAKLTILSEGFRPWKAPSDGGELDMQSLLEERIGAEAARKLAGAFVRGIYAADLADLGVRSAFPKLDELLVQHRSFLRALASISQVAEDLPGPKVAGMELLSFPEGLDELVRALTRALGERIHTQRAALSIARSGGAWRVRTTQGELEARELVLALPAPQARTLLEPHADMPEIAHGDLVLVQQGFSLPEGERWPRGFGFLVPPGERGPQPRALGVIFSSNLFAGRAPRGMHSTASFYARSALEGLDDGERIAQAGRDLALGLGWKRPPQALASRIWNWNSVIPRYSPGHRDRVEALEQLLRSRAAGLHLAGPWVGGVSVEQVIARGRLVAGRILQGGPA